jgi:polysaccharide export outer membrane protein
MRKLRQLIYFFAILVFFASCVSQKKALYIQDQAKQNVFDKEYVGKKAENIIEVYDEIYISVTSLDENKLNFFNNQMGNSTAGARSPAELSLIAYRVDSEGNIDLPILGKIRVVGLTMDEATKMVRQELLNYLNSPSVRMMFVNRNVTVIGYVRSPGRYYYAGEYINVFQAMGLAGDATEFANRKTVVVIREVNNKITKNRIDLTSKNVMESPYYYLDSNDIVYVEPLEQRKWGIETFPYAIILSTITAAVLVADFIR